MYGKRMWGKLPNCLRYNKLQRFIEVGATKRTVMYWDYTVRKGADRVIVVG